MQVHVLKCWEPYFTDIRNGVKRFEIRLNDRNYCVGDVLVLRGYCPFTGRYSGGMLSAEIIYMLDGQQFGIEPGYCVMGLGEYHANIFFEDQLPEMTNEEYNKWFEKSFIVDGVRIGFNLQLET